MGVCVCLCVRVCVYVLKYWGLCAWRVSTTPARPLWIYTTSPPPLRSIELSAAKINETAIDLTMDGGSDSDDELGVDFDDVRRLLTDSDCC